MIRETCNHIGQEAQLATSNQKWQSWMCPFFDDFLHAKILRGRLILSRNIDDQRILQSDKLRAFSAITKEPDFSQTWDFAEF